MYTDSSQTMDLEITAKHPLKFVMITRTVAHLSFFLIGGVLHIRRLRARYFHISAVQSKLETATTAIVVSDLYPLYSSACRFLHLICGSGGSTCSRKVANRCLNHPRPLFPCLGLGGTSSFREASDRYYLKVILPL